MSDTKIKPQNNECIVTVVTSGKGGVGKTTVCANIAMALSLLGKKVCIIDADIGLRNLDIVTGLENRIVYDIMDVVEGKCAVEKALIKDKRIENLYLLPASQTHEKEDINVEDLKIIIECLKAKFNYIFIDCPAGIEQGFKNTIMVSDFAIIVVTPEVSSVRDADRILGMLESINMSGIEMVINKIRPNLVLMRKMMSVADIEEILSIHVLGIVPDHEDIIVSTNIGEPVVMIKDSEVGQAFRNIARRLDGETVEYLNIFEKKGLFNWFTNLFYK